MLHLNIAGKTSILCHLANVVAANKGVVKSVGTTPTVATQMVEFRRRNVRWVAWDMSGQGAVLVYQVLSLSESSRIQADILTRNPKVLASDCWFIILGMFLLSARFSILAFLGLVGKMGGGLPASERNTNNLTVQNLGNCVSGTHDATLTPHRQEKQSQSGTECQRVPILILFRGRTISRPLGCTRRACPRRGIRCGCHRPRENRGG